MMIDVQPTPNPASLKFVPPWQVLESGTLDFADDETVTQIKELIETKVRPAVAQDGGAIRFDRFEEGVEYLHMQGACAGCPGSTMTLKQGIETMLRHYIPEVVEVLPVIG